MNQSPPKPEKKEEPEDIDLLGLDLVGNKENQGPTGKIEMNGEVDLLDLDFSDPTAQNPSNPGKMDLLGNQVDLDVDLIVPPPMPV